MDPTAVRKRDDHLAFQRALECAMLTAPGGYLQGLRRLFSRRGAANRVGFVSADCPGPLTRLPFRSGSGAGICMWLDTSAGPLVVELPPNVVGSIDDHWFRYVANLGVAGPDLGRGGKYLLLPPGHRGTSPAGYCGLFSPTFGNWLVLNELGSQGKSDLTNRLFEDGLRVYPLSESVHRPLLELVPVSEQDLQLSGLPAEEFFAEIHQIVQEEPLDSLDPVVLALLASLSIEKGVPFDPDARLTRILTEAARVGVRVASTPPTLRPFDEPSEIETGGWSPPWSGVGSNLVRDWARLPDARSRYQQAVPGLVEPAAGAEPHEETDYLACDRDSEGLALDGGQRYRLHLPPEVTGAGPWAISLYDPRRRSLLRSDQVFPGLGSDDVPLEEEAAPCEIQFGPEAPSGDRVHWIQTVPGKGWSALLRYSSNRTIPFRQGPALGRIERLDLHQAGATR